MDYGFQETAALLGISSRMLGKWSAYFASFLSLADQAVPDADGGAAGRRYTEADIATLRQVKQLRAARLTYEQVHARLEALHTASGADQTSPQGKQAGVADAQAPVEDAARDPSAQPEAAQGAMSAFLQLPPELQDELNQLRPDQPEPAPHEEAPPVAPARALPPPAQPAVPGDQPGMLPREWTAVGARFPSAPAALRNHPAAQSRPQQSLDAHEGTRDEGYAQKKNRHRHAADAQLVKGPRQRTGHPLPGSWQRRQAVRGQRDS